MRQAPNLLVLKYSVAGRAARIRVNQAIVSLMVQIGHYEAIAERVSTVSRFQSRLQAFCSGPPDSYGCWMVKGALNDRLDLSHDNSLDIDLVVIG